MVGAICHVEAAYERFDLIECYFNVFGLNARKIMGYEFCGKAHKMIDFQVRNSAVSIFIMARKNIEEAYSAPWFVRTTFSRFDLVYVSTCEVVRCVYVWTCVSLQCVFIVLPSSRPCCPFIQKETKQHPLLL